MRAGIGRLTRKGGGRRHANAGFALIITVSLMVLIAVVAVGMLSLSSVALRTSSTMESRNIARANARLAMQMALSRLQELAGPDTRVTAPASAVAGVNGPRQLFGVWRSWEGDDHDSSGRPIAPDYDSKLEDASDSGSGDGKFLGWLISGSGADNSASSPADLTEGGSKVALLSEGSLGEGSDLGVYLEPTRVNDEGAYAWWIEGENTKARLKPVEEADDTFAATEQLLVSPGPNGSGFGIDDTSKTDQSVTLQTMDFLTSDESVIPSEFYHDLTPYSRGLLTNVANGGWRRDLSVLAERWSSVPNGFASFTLRPGEVHESGKSNTSAPSSQHPLIYPWIDDWSPSYAFPDCVSWEALVNYATQYKEIRTSGNPVVRMLNATDRMKENWADEIRRIPVLARVHLVISLTAQADSSNPGQYIPSILVNPVITMWNPYSIALDLSNRSNLPLKLSDAACPIEFEFKVGSTTVRKDLAQIVAHKTSNSTNLQANLPLNSPPLWLPGEVRVYSPEGTEIADKNIGNVIEFEAGYRPDSGLRYELRDGQNNVFSSQPASTTFSVTAAELVATFNGPNVQGTGIYFTHTLGSGKNSTTNVQCMLDADDAARMLGVDVPLTATSSSALASLAHSPQPVVSVISSLRYSRDTNPIRNNIVVNGIHNMNPIVGFMVNGTEKTDGHGTTGGSGTTGATDLKGRFDVFPYNVQVFPVNSLEDPGMPSGLSGDLEGYIGSGFSSSDGLSNMILLELPTRPLRTIGDLTHFNVNACDDSGPYTLNAFGNSRPSPFIEMDKIRVSEGGSNELGHDHSYAINHVLADDWFVSSIAPEMNEWSATRKRTMQEVYEDHVSGKEPLPNHYYVPAPGAEDSADFLSESESWEKVAAQLEVEGMFNINSTSELAWEMLLKRNFGSGSGSVLALQDSTPGNMSATASLEDSENPFPRSLPVSDASAGGLGGGSLLTQAPEFTDEQIEALAREIVAQIKERGPFLSLSEFYNRQLSKDTDLAKAGAVEAALLTLSEGSASENPYRDLQSVFGEEASTTDVLGNQLSYPFPEAARGNPAYGFPGWTRQADVLRPLSGFLSARDDTFTIRAYGDARDASDNVVSRAWCEVVVQRRAEFVDNSPDGGDDKYTLPSDDTLNSEANQRFGRGFEIISFRWLNAEEV